MSLWKIGADDISQETQQFKDKLASKDSQIAAQQAQLIKQTQELEEIKASLNEALRKLAEESERALHLEKDLIQCKEDLRNEKNTSRNIEASLEAANTKLKAKNIETRDLEATLERISGTSNEHNARSTKLEHEKIALETRIRELESNIRQLQSAAASSRRVPSRSSSSKFNDLKINALERELSELRERLVEKDNDLNDLRERLSHAQDELLRVDNDRMAKEAKAKTQLEEMRSLLQEKDEELDFYKGQQSDGGREEELLQRIEEDEAKIAALEAMLKQSDDMKGLREKLRNVERRLKLEIDKVADLESRNISLVQERQDALNELEGARSQIHILEDRVQENKGKIDSMKQERSRLALAIDEPDFKPIDNFDTITSVDGVDVTHIAKLLEAIARLRGERDDLRRRLEFLETEHKFTVEALEKRLAEAPPASQNLESVIGSETGTSTIEHAQISADIQSKDDSVRRLAHAATAYAVLLLHSQTQLEQCNQLLSDSMGRERCARDRADAETEKCSALEEEMNQIACQLKESEEKVKDLETKLDVTLPCLEAMTCQRDDLVSQLEANNAEWEDMKLSRKSLHDQLEKIEVHLGEVSRTLEVVESERDSLALQVTNLTADLQAAQDELASAESRYSALQFHQLSSMTSDEANQALREQITELEARVMRRTEQIGIHQHDIRRLETNLRLQEERLGEMTMELETLATQKEAMLEDCADAREARDEALAQIETLELELETLESKLADSDGALNTLICLLVQTTNQSRSSAQRLQSRITELEMELNKSQTAYDTLETDLVDIQTSQTEDLRQTTVALAVTQLQFSSVITRIRGLIAEKDELLRDFAVVNKQAEEQAESSHQLTEECAGLCHGSSTSVAELASRSSKYQAEIDQLKQAISEAKAEAEALRQQVMHSTTKLQNMQEEKDSLVAEQGKATSNLIQAHKEEMEVLQKNLARATTTAEEERAIRIALEQDHMEALAQAQSKVEELEKHAETLNEELSGLYSSQESLRAEREATAQELESLRVELEGLLAEKAKAEKVQHELTTANNRLAGEITQLQKERETTMLDAKSYVDKHQQELESQKVELQSKVDELTRAVEEATQEIQHLSQELDQERRRLRDSEDQRSAELQSLSREREAARSSLSKLQHDVTELQNTIERNEAALAKSEGEKGHLQENITGLEAQIQKSLSYTHALERQIQDGERALETLKTNLSNTQLELSHAETRAKTAEMNLNLQSAQFKRELAKLQDKLAALEPRRDLEEALAGLEERNNEMEELLKAKCAEIEENDDRALEMLKENKKLSAKVEALTRKAQNLQTKLAAAKAAVANSKATAEAVPASTKPSPTPLVEAAETQAAEIQAPTARRRSSRQSTSTTASSSHEKPPTAQVSRSSSRVASGPPTATGTVRPRTPERRLAPTPVFKLRTPEQRRAQERTSAPPLSVAGVKRRAPDDFEACETVPPQGFTVDSLPSRENETTTPRVRRMFSNLQPGFTPIRNKVLSSPKRQSAVLSTPLIQDVTNSPRNSVPLDSAKQSKRSWLGKIRGTTTQAAVKPAPRQVFTFTGETQLP